MAGMVDALGQTPKPCQSTMAAQIAGQLIDHKFHRISHLRFLPLKGAKEMWAKCFFCMWINPCRGGDPKDLTIKSLDLSISNTFYV